VSGELDELAGLDLESAREYIFAHAVDIKRLEKEIAALRSEAELWKSRVELAQSKGRSDLETAAKSRVDETEAKINELESERSELRAKLTRLREQLPILQARERSIDPDLLLAELQLMTGELLGDTGDAAAATEREFAKLEADRTVESELAELKRKNADDGRGDQ
jgi:phage shock protein A